MKQFYLLKRDANTLADLQAAPDLIYLDPPFGTNKIHSMATDTTRIEFSDVWTAKRFDEWFPTIVNLCFNVLSKQGTLYVHNNFVSNAKLMSSLSPALVKRYMTTIYWERSHPHNNIRRVWGNIVDTILVFTKTNNYFFEVQYSPLDAKYAANSFNHSDAKGSFALAPITGEKSRPGYDFEYKGFRPKYGWRKSKKDVMALDKENCIYFGKNKPYRKVYSIGNRGCPIHNFWEDIPPITRRESRQYPTQKPINLLKRIITASCPKDGLIFDPFCGSNVTMRAAIDLNATMGAEYRCISSDLNDDALNLSRTDLTKLDVECDYVGMDIWPMKP